MCLCVCVWPRGWCAGVAPPWERVDPDQPTKDGAPAIMRVRACARGARTVAAAVLPTSAALRLLPTTPRRRHEAPGRARPAATRPLGPSLLLLLSPADLVAVSAITRRRLGRIGEGNACGTFRCATCAQDWRWAVGCVPWGPYANCTSVSGTLRASARRNQLLSHVEVALQAVQRRLDEIDGLVAEVYDGPWPVRAWGFACGGKGGRGVLGWRVRASR